MMNHITFGKERFCLLTMFPMAECSHCRAATPAAREGRGWRCVEVDSEAGVVTLEVET